MGDEDNLQACQGGLDLCKHRFDLGVIAKAYFGEFIVVQNCVCLLMNCILEM